MADDKTTPSWTSEPDSVEIAERYKEGVGDVMEESGGISNRPLAEEISRQEALPPRNTTRKDEKMEGEVD